MKRAMLAFTLFAVLAAPALAGQTQTLKLFIPAITDCPSCPYIVKSVLSRIDGVKEVDAVYATGIATIVYDGASITPADIRKALLDYGYDADPVAPEG